MAYGAILNQKNSFESPTITVTGLESGTVVTLNRNGVSVTGIERDNNGTPTWVFTPWEFGDYTVIATGSGGLSGITNQTMISVTSVTAYNVTLFVASSTLNNNTWSNISTIGNASQASNFWSVGDAKEITLNGQIGSINFDNTSLWVFIIGFNQSNKVSGGKCPITFQGFRTESSYSQSSGVALFDSSFKMNTYSNVSTWAETYMRNTILNANATSPLEAQEGSLLYLFPLEVKQVMKQIINRTGIPADNRWQGFNQTNDWLFLLSQYEISGQTNSFQSSPDGPYYTFYRTGNTPPTTYYPSSGSSFRCWLRNPYAKYGYYSYILETGTDIGYNYVNPSISCGICPVFAL